MSNNYFVRLSAIDGSIVTVRPEHIVAVVEYPEADWVNIHLSNGRYYEIPKGQISLDVLINHCQHAGVRVL